MSFREEIGYTAKDRYKLNCYHSKGGRVYPNEVTPLEYENLFMKNKTLKIGEKSLKQKTSKARENLKIDSVFDYNDDNVSEASTTKKFYESSQKKPPIQKSSRNTRKYNQKKYSKTKSDMIRAGKIQQRSTINMIKIIESDLRDIIYRLKERIERFGGYGCEYENGDLTCRSQRSGRDTRFNSVEQYQIKSLKLKAKALFFEGMNLVKNYYDLNFEYNTGDRRDAFSHGMKNFVKRGVNFDNEVDCLEAVIKIRRKLKNVIQEYEEDWNIVCSIIEDSGVKKEDELFRKKKGSGKKIDFDKEIRQRESSRRTSQSRGKSTPRDFKGSESTRRTNRNYPEIEVIVTKRSRSRSKSNSGIVSKRSGFTISPTTNNENHNNNERFERVEQQLKQIMEKLENLQFMNPNEEKENYREISMKTYLENTTDIKQRREEYDVLSEQKSEDNKQINDSFTIPPPKPFRTTATDFKDSPFREIEENNKKKKNGKLQSNTPNLIRKENQFTIEPSKIQQKLPPSFIHPKFDSVNDFDPINAFDGIRNTSNSNEKNLKENEILCFRKPLIQPEVFITPVSSIYTGEVELQHCPSSMNCSRVFYNSKYQSRNSYKKYNTGGGQESSGESEIHVIPGSFDGRNFTLSGNGGEGFKEVEAGNVLMKKKRNLETQGEYEDSEVDEAQIDSYTLSDVNTLEYEIFKVREERAQLILRLEKLLENSKKILKVAVSGCKIEEMIDENIFQLKTGIVEFSSTYKFTSEADKQLEKNLKILNTKLKKAKSLLNQSCLFEGETKDNFIFGIYGLIEKSIYCFEKYVEIAKEQYSDILPISSTTTPIKRREYKENEGSEIVVNDFDEGEKSEEVQEVEQENLEEYQFRETPDLSRNNSNSSKSISEESIYEEDEETPKITSNNSEVEINHIELEIKENDELHQQLEIIIEKNERHETSSNLEIIDCSRNEELRQVNSQGNTSSEEEEDEDQNNFEKEKTESSVKIVTVKGGIIEGPNSTSYYHTTKTGNLMSTNGATLQQQREYQKKGETAAWRTSKTVELKNFKYDIEYSEYFDEREYSFNKNEEEEDEWSNLVGKFSSGKKRKEDIRSGRETKRRVFASQEVENQEESAGFDEIVDPKLKKRLKIPPDGFELKDAETPSSLYSEDLKLSLPQVPKKKLIKFEIKEGKGNITVIKLIPNSDKCVIGLSSGELIFYSISKKEVLHLKKKHKGSIISLEYIKIEDNSLNLFENNSKNTPKKEYIISGGGDKETSIIVWDLEKMKALKKFSGHKNRVSCVKNLGDNATIVSTSYDSKIAFWDLKEKFNCVQLLDDHSGPISCLNVNPKSKTLVTATLSGEIIFWNFYLKGGVYDSVTLMKKLQLKGHIIELSLPKSNPSDLIVLESDAKVRIYSSETGEVKGIIKSESPFTDFILVERENLQPLVYCIKKGCEAEKFDSWNEEFVEEDKVNLLGNKINETNLRFIKEMFGGVPRSQVLVKDDELYLVGFEKKMRRIVFREIEF